MKDMAVPRDGNVVIGMGTSDDAGVYRIDDSTALVQTVDFITPIVDDPFTFGRIAACNSLSDVYAMGGRPLTALNILCFPTGKFTLDVMREILLGGLAVLEEAKTQLMGGHSVDDPELKYGLAVTGLVDPARAVRNDALRGGDALILTKPLGTGVIATAVKAGMAEETVTGPFVRSMASLNRTAAELMLLHGAHACTDVTGFGFIGHLSEMLGGAALEIVIDSSAVPLLPGARAAAAGGLIPAGMYRNRDFVGSLCRTDPSMPSDILDILFDPQTSGGLLIALEEERAGGLLRDLQDRGVDGSAIVGHVAGGSSPGILVR